MNNNPIFSGVLHLSSDWLEFIRFPQDVCVAFCSLSAKQSCHNMMLCLPHVGCNHIYNCVNECLKGWVKLWTFQIMTGQFLEGHQLYIFTPLFMMLNKMNNYMPPIRCRTTSCSIICIYYLLAVRYLLTDLSLNVAVLLTCLCWVNLLEQWYSNRNYLKEAPEYKAEQ